MSCTGQSAATQIAATPSAKHTAWNLVTGDRPAAAYRGPTRKTVTAYVAASPITSSHTSTWGCQLGYATATPMARLFAEHVQSRQHDQVQRDGGHDPEHEEAPEDRQVGLEVHVPRGDQRELD